MVIEVNKNYCGDHFPIYTKMESLCCTSETVVYQLYYLKFLVEITLEEVSSCWNCKIIFTATKQADGKWARERRLVTLARRHSQQDPFSAGNYRTAEDERRKQDTKTRQILGAIMSSLEATNRIKKKKRIYS